MTESKKPLTILLASSHGFCAGFERAVQIVECNVPDDRPVVFSARGVLPRQLVA